MFEVFRGCSNLIGDIIIKATDVTVLADCFTDTNASKAKTMKCWKYENGADSGTYNLAMNVCDGKNGVTVTSVDRG